MALAALINAQSALKNGEKIKSYILQNDLDLLAVTETFAKPDDEQGYRDLKVACCPPGYDVKHQPRLSRGGGVALIYKTETQILVTKLPDESTSHYEQFEFIDLNIKFTQYEEIRIIIIYRPPSKGKLKLKFIEEEFESFLRLIAPKPLNKDAQKNLLIVGDFNIHVNNVKDSSGRKFLGLISRYDMTQHVREPTYIHKSGNTLDLVISYSKETLVSDIVVDSSNRISDHKPVKFKINYSSHEINDTIDTPVQEALANASGLTPEAANQMNGVGAISLSDDSSGTKQNHEEIVNEPITNNPTTELPVTSGSIHEDATTKDSFDMVKTQSCMFIN